MLLERTSFTLVGAGAIAGTSKNTLSEDAKLKTALSHLLQLGTLAGQNPQELPLVFLRLHNCQCPEAPRNSQVSDLPLRCGKLFLTSKTSCDCCSTPAMELQQDDTKQSTTTSTRTFVVYKENDAWKGNPKNDPQPTGYYTGILQKWIFEPVSYLWSKAIAHITN